MVKDEEDIIFENLVWHFTLGFRKFIIINNNSTDNTRKLVEKFAELTQNQAKVFIIDDPIMEYIQSRITTGAYEFAKFVWPELEWVFPVDADEFWVPTQSLETILANIPKNIDALFVSCAKHLATQEYYDFAEGLKFFEKIPYRQKSLSIGLGKIALRTSNENIIIAQGNHSVESKLPKFLAKKLKLAGQIKYIGGNSLGLHMTEYPMRSISQAHRKLVNGAKANIAAQKLGYIGQDQGTHWSSYAEDLNKFGNEAARKRFEESFIAHEKAISDPLPIKEAMELFYKIIQASKIESVS